MELNTRVPESADRDFVAGAYIIENGKILLVDHKKLDVWLPPGGHVEEGETPDEAAKRETLEEVGLKIEISGKEKNYDKLSAVDIAKPFNINLHRIKKDHWHLDFQYTGSIESKKGEKEYSDNEIKWFNKEEVQQEENMLENVRQSILKAFEM